MFLLDNPCSRKNPRDDGMTSKSWDDLRNEFFNRKKKVFVINFLSQLKAFFKAQTPSGASQ